MLKLYAKRIILLFFILGLISTTLFVVIWQRTKVIYLERRADLSLEDKRLQLLNSPSRSYLHPEVEDYLKHHKVYISLSTTPKRIKHLTKIFQTLDLRNVEKILLAIPKFYKKANETYTIPADLTRKYPKVKILHVSEDLGPITKLIPAVEYAKKIDPQAIVITIDDDVLYPFGMVNEMIHYLVLNNSVVAAIAFDIAEKQSRWFINYSFPWGENYKKAKS